MKKILSIALLLLSLFTFAGTPNNDLEAAKQQAKTENKFILLKFSGSDWCIPCIKFQKNVMDSATFKTYAEQHLVLMEADFPRKTKNQLSAEDQKKNDALAEKFNKEGVFPKIILLDADGNVVAQWSGFKDFTAEQFVTELKNYIK